MSRKRAIEAAMKRLADGADECRLYGVRTKHREPIDICEEMEAIWAEGRIAGLREAARMCVISAGPDLRKHARELAKKARGK